MHHCEHCGGEHESLEEHWTEIKRLHTAIDRLASREKDGPPTFGISDGVRAIISSLFDANYPRVQTEDDYKAMACDMMVLLYALGVSTHDTYIDQIGLEPVPTEEEVKEDYQNFLKQHQTRQSMRDQIKELIEKSGLDIDVDAVEVVSMDRMIPLQRQARHDTDDGGIPGQYL